MIKDFIKKCIKKNAIFIAIILLVGFVSPTLIKAENNSFILDYSQVEDYLNYEYANGISRLEILENQVSLLNNYIQDDEMFFIGVDRNSDYVGIIITKKNINIRIRPYLRSGYSSGLRLYVLDTSHEYKSMYYSFTQVNSNSNIFKDYFSSSDYKISSVSNIASNTNPALQFGINNSSSLPVDYFSVSESGGNYTDIPFYFSENINIINSTNEYVRTVKYMDKILTLNDTFPTYYDWKYPKLPDLDKKHLPKQIYSVDFYLDPTIDYKYDITLTRANDISNIRASAFKFYGLKENNGLYNWEEINPTTTGCAVEDYTSSYTDNTYNFTVTAVETACNDLILNNTYKDIIFKVIFNNAIHVDNISNKALAKHIFYNGFSEKHIIQKFDTQFFKYINFSTTLEEYPYYFDFNLNSDNIYIDLFDTSTNKFVEYVNYSNDLDKIYKKYYLSIGQSLNRGFWLTYNYPMTPAEKNNWMDFDFNFGYVPDNLYYSINVPNGNLRNDGAIIVDSEGNPIIIDLEPSPDINFGRKGVNNLSDIFKTINDYMRDNNRLISEIGNIINNIFSSLNSEIKNFIIAVYSLFIISSLAVLIRR